VKIALVSEHASPLATLGGRDAGGQNVHVGSLAASLARRGLDVAVYTRRDDPSTPRRVRLAPRVVVEQIDAGPPAHVDKDQMLPYMDDFASELVHRWRASPPDLVHSHFWMSGKASLAASRKTGVPVVQTFHALGVVKRRHQGRADPSAPERLAVEADIARRADRIIATCSDEVFELLRIGAESRRVSVVPCGVDLVRFCVSEENAAPSVARASGRRRVLSVGRLVERKGVADVISALVQLPDVELIVAGGPAAEELGTDADARRLLGLARSLGVDDRVVLIGRVAHDEVPALMRSAEVVVCAPWYEPFGIVPLEAMACGVPVVATAVGGLIDTVMNGVTGFHVRPRSPMSIAGALRRLLDDDELRRRFARAGAARVRARFGWERIAEATHDVYLNTVNHLRRANSGSER
jgi:D-inositol-3-phosphate glycosyltransferase